METLYTIEEVANTLKVSVPTIRAWIQRKKIKYIKVGNLIRIKGSELDRIIEGK